MKSGGVEGNASYHLTLVPKGAVWVGKRMIQDLAINLESGDPVEEKLSIAIG